MRPAMVLIAHPTTTAYSLPWIAEIPFAAVVFWVLPAEVICNLLHCVGKRTAIENGRKEIE